MKDFEQIYRANVNIVYRYLFSLTRDPDLAEDLTSQTFLEAIRSIHRYRGESQLSTYLCGIARNLLRKEREKQSRRRECPLEDAKYLPSGETTEETVLAEMNRQEIYRRIRGLPPKLREVVCLRISGELSFKEIGAIMGESETWARVTFYRAKQRLVKGDERNA